MGWSWEAAEVNSHSSPSLGPTSGRRNPTQRFLICKESIIFYPLMHPRMWRPLNEIKEIKCFGKA